MALGVFLLLWPQRTSNTSVQTAPPPFARDIAVFKDLDKKNPPARGQILFIGSSSFTRWTDVSSYFPDYKILNRAFGGSTLPDVIRYVNDMVFPYQPGRVVIYCGENDIASDSKLPAYVVAERFKTLFHLIRQKLPTVPIAYVSMKPSPSRWHMRAKFIAANRWIAEFMSHEESASFINVWDAMLDANGLPKAGIYVGDQLHMNAAGYRIWQPIIERYLRSTK